MRVRRLNTRKAPLGGRSLSGLPVWLHKRKLHALWVATVEQHNEVFIKNRTIVNMPGSKKAAPVDDAAFPAYLNAAPPPPGNCGSK